MRIKNKIQFVTKITITKNISIACNQSSFKKQSFYYHHYTNNKKIKLRIQNIN